MRRRKVTRSRPTRESKVGARAVSVATLAGTYANLSDAALRARAIIGYACACPEPSARPQARL